MIIQSKYLATIKATINGKSKSLFSLTRKKNRRVRTLKNQERKNNKYKGRRQRTITKKQDYGKTFFNRLIKKNCLGEHWLRNTEMWCVK